MLKSKFPKFQTQIRPTPTGRQNRKSRVGTHSPLEKSIKKFFLCLMYLSKKFIIFVE